MAKTAKKAVEAKETTAEEAPKENPTIEITLEQLLAGIFSQLKVNNAQLQKLAENSEKMGEAMDKLLKLQPRKESLKGVKAS